MMSCRSSCAYAAVLVILLAAISSVHAAVFNCVGGAVYAVAHADDDLLFQSPTLLDDVASGDCTTTIVLTAGDSGAGSSYANGRELGNQAAYAQMYGVNSTWTEFYATFGGQPVLVRTLVAKPQHQNVYFRLPDGGWDTGGYAVNNWQTLRGLYFSSIPSITSVPGDATYTLATLKQAIAQILAARQPDRVRTLDYLSQYGGGDHDDHLTTGRIIADLVGSYAPSASLSGMMGYPIQNLAPTLDTTSASYINKAAAFFAYTPYDADECQSLSACASRGEASWLQRQYVVTSALATTSTTDAAQTPAVMPDGSNIAPFSVATASSSESISPPSAAIDGVITGYPRNETAEWVSDHEGAGAWLKLTWRQPVSISAVVLFDRPNADDWLQAGVLSIDDGSSMTFTNPVNDGSPYVVQLPGTFSTTSLLLQVTQVSSTTSEVGISELQVYGTCSFCNAATPSTTSSAPAATATGSLATDLALNATASASSWAASTGQTPDKAIDGVVSGYKADGTGDYTKEWTTDHEGTGAYLGLQWTSPVTANRIVLYDRPNLDDQVTSGTITFPDGSILAVPTLANDGSATTVNFATKTFSSLVFTVNSVSNTTSNVGLAEIQVYFVSSATASTTSAVPVSTTVSSTVVSSSSVAPSSTTSSLPVATGSSSVDLALNATAGASSWAASTGQTPDKAIDGIVSGYKEDGTGDYTKEWASDHEGAGAQFSLSWTSAITANRFVLHDRPNLNDQITSGYILFPDHSTLSIPSLANDGSATTVDFPTKSFDSMIFYITGASNTTSSVGLAELQVYYIPTGASSTASASSVASTTSPSSSSSPSLSATISSRTTITFASSASASASPSAASSPPSTAVTAPATVASAISSSSTVSTVSSASLASPSVLSASSASHTVSVASSASATVSSANASSPASSSASSTSTTASSAIPSSTSLINYAQRVQSITASSSSTSTGQTPDKAIDGVISGYPANYSAEFATDHQGAGAWLSLNWTSPVTINQVILYDRPNADDQILNATLRFSDGTLVSTGALVNDGSATYVNFTARATTQILLTVVSVSSTTSNAGLAEIQVFNNPNAVISSSNSLAASAAAPSSASVLTTISASATTSKAATSSSSSRSTTTTSTKKTSTTTTKAVSTTTTRASSSTSRSASTSAAKTARL